MFDVKNKVRSFIVDNYLFGDEEGLEEHTSFLDEGIVDSTGILELINFESNYQANSCIQFCTNTTTR